ncbi:SIR2 family protein [Desulfosarcina ovata]|uniref:Effector-associated domain-containing protein n=1 Tax=Desulfosarcina ovata subsp. ovata TaxID=2752305 RepID=A0A5K8ACQ6_9BACT|nr:SIR2 family protein [Desulfosarcina ovata]BBO90405.1 hypothetical protein DSCOOX_35850 [Desulfosarcina ovata subsp. ovata]
MQIPISIEEIVKSFKHDKVIILLGPDIVINKNGDTLLNNLLKYLREQNFDKDIDLGRDNLFICDNKTKNRMYSFIEEYFQSNTQTSKIYEQLALIPCHLIVSITPDSLMKQAFEDCGIDHAFRYYVKNKPGKEVDVPTKEKPLLYNLFGSIEDQNSLVCNLDDLLQFLFSIIKEYELPINLRRSFDVANYFVFLGFNFNKWYLKLLLKLLNLTTDKFSMAAEYLLIDDDKLIRTYDIHYGVKIIETDIEKFVNDLYEKSRELYYLREKKEITQISIKEVAKDLMKQDKIKESIDIILEELESREKKDALDSDQKDMLDEIIGLSARYHRLERSSRKNTLSKDDVETTRNKLVEALKDIVDEISF